MTATQAPTPGPLSGDDDLLPCPFCEGDVIVTDSQECQDAETYYWHRCAGCGVESEGAHGASAARDQWNMRPQPFRLAPTAPVEASGQDDDLKLIIAHTIIEDLRAQHPGIEQIDNERGDIWLPGGSTPQSSGCIVDIHSVAQSVEQQVLAALRPGHTDLMVSPESIDAFLEANPPPVEASGSERERLARAIDPYAWDDGQYAEPGGKGQQWSQEAARKAADRVLALRPQPSGETREAVAELIEAAIVRHDPTIPLDSTLDDADAILALLSARPPARAEGQEGEVADEEDDDDDPHSPCSVCGDEYPDGVLEDGRCPSCCDKEED